MRQETKAHFLVGTVILGFLSFSKRVRHRHLLKPWIPCASGGIKVMWFPLSRLRHRTTAFSRVSTGDPDIPSSCEMKHEPEFKPLQGNMAFFWVRVSRRPFHLRQKTQGPSHIPIAEGKLHLRCWWKFGSNLQSKTGNLLSSWDDMGCMELSSSCCSDINIHIDLRRVSQGISVDSSKKSSHLYCVLWNTG